MALNFNNRGIGVVDYPGGGRSYAARKRTGEPPGTLDDSALKRTSKMLLDSFLVGDPMVNNIDKLLLVLRGNFFLLSANAKILALAIYHLYLSEFYSIEGDKIIGDVRFELKADMYKGQKLKEDIKTLYNSAKYSASSEGESYKQFEDKTIITIFRYQRYIIKLYTN